MLQFITHPSDKYSIAEEVQMVLEGGCRWIQLRLKDTSDEEFRAVATEIIPMCQEHNAFLVFDDRVQLALEMHVHGVHLGKDDMPVTEARELMGPEAIIGATAHTAQDILALKGVDVDYIGLGPFSHTFTKKNALSPLGFPGYEEIVSDVRDKGITFPIVAIGGIKEDDISPLLKTGINGIAMSSAIINSADPVEYTRNVLRKLQD